MPQKVQVLKTADLPAGECRAVTANGIELAVYNVDGKFYVLKNECPHSGGPLGEGMLDGTTVTCPWHGWQFDVCTGKGQGRPRNAQAVPALVEGDWLTVEL